MHRYDVIWNSPSQNSLESMPVGGFDTGLNVWVEGGDLLFYVERSGSLDENNQQLKLGRVRLRMTPNTLGAPGLTFCQRLHLERGRVSVTASAPGYPDVSVELYVETERPAVHVHLRAERPVSLAAHYENWRYARRHIPQRYRMAALSINGAPEDSYTEPDCVFIKEDQVVFYHQNDNDKNVINRAIRAQGLSEYEAQMYDPMRDLIFGGVMACPQMTYAGTGSGQYAGTEYRSHILSGQGTAFDLEVMLHAGQYKDAFAWEHALRDMWAQAPEDPSAQAEQFWREFFARSYIRINDGRGETDAGWQVGRNYNIFRYQLGCNRQGSFPTKFNGGLFTPDARWVDERFGEGTPDFRRWGGGSITLQNQRLLYWPMLKSGDFEYMLPQFDFFTKALINAKLRVKANWGHEGCAFTEQLENYGLPPMAQYGYEQSQEFFRIRHPGCDPTEVFSPAIRYQYAHQVEFAYMILAYYRYSGQDIAPYMDFVKSALVFIDEHYQYRNLINTIKKLDDDGKLVFFPSTGAETYKNATNPTDLVAAMQATLDWLLGLPELLSEEEREYFTGLRARLPEISLREMGGHTVIAPAQSFTFMTNVDVPQLYPVFPFDQYGVGREGLTLARDTWHYGIENEKQKSHISWHQSNIFCARLGLVEEAREQTVKKLADSPQRFPTFWGPGHDWLPDHNWGGSGAIGLQDMLLLCVRDKIHLFAAWPLDWDVEFKLYAEFGTVVTAGLKDGKITHLQVDPPHRMNDIVLPEGLA